MPELSDIVRVNKLLVVANPAAGKDEPVLATLNAAFRDSRIEWDISVTRESGDAERLAREAAEAGEVDAVAAYGGDGTQMEVASGLAGTGVPLAILPGGTANVLANEFGVPPALADAAAALAGEMRARGMDLGEMETGDGLRRRFALRVGAGLEAAMVAGATREQKDRLGELAYVKAALQELREPETARYTITLDGRVEEVDALSVMIGNSGALPHVEFKLAPDIQVDDGALDVVVFTRADLPSVVSVAAAVMSEEEPPKEQTRHWRAKEITLQSDPPQTLVADGEEAGMTPVTVRVLPAAVKVLVPATQRD